MIKMGLFSIKQAKPKEEKTKPIYAEPTAKPQEQENQEVGQVEDENKSLNDW